MHTAPSTTPLAFCSINYNKSATIATSLASDHSSKEATHKRTMTRKRSAVIAGSSCSSSSSSIINSGSSRSFSQRAAIKQKHRRSLRYTRTLDIIIEETHQQHDQEETTRHNNTNNGIEKQQSLLLFPSMLTSTCSTTSKHKQHLVLPEEQNGNADDCSSCYSPNTTALTTTDFLLSMRSMKKSATAVSLDSLFIGEDSIISGNSNTNITEITNTNDGISNIVEPIEALSSSMMVEEGEDFENFLDDWDL
uniref:Uncharacterized protein n=1 Tax=Pseudo-nitzschia australis TaxID=44445 RepID=A0A7S4EJR3_9STRA|mmetsp:Transcript_21841/g.47510  ORF Transcript_21841/g.47510 Transcript_21841/m.47510 type:complete len:250 (+) Transcript_21841:203-952(+)